MGTEVRFTDSPDDVLHDAAAFLHSDPVRHNVILTLLETRVAYPEPGNYWIVRVDGHVRGVALQSPTHFFATLTPMDAVTVTALVDSIVDHGVHLPGVAGEAAAAACFAGHWTERRRAAAHPVAGNRIYEVEEVVAPIGVAGCARLAASEDRDFVVRSFEGFASETGDSGSHAPTVVAEHRLRVGQLWVWDDTTPVSMAGLSEPAAGVVRVGPVYTPPEHRNRGYGSALVAAISQVVLDRGDRCVLSTDLGNPTSNAIYRGLGYRAVDEALRYEFSASD